MTLSTSIAFVGVALLVALAPGPDNLFVLMQAATNGRKSGMLVVLGLCTGLLVHTCAVVFGLAAVFAASAAAFTVLKFVGAAYLAYLAWQAWRAPAETDLRPAGEAGASRAGRRLYLRGVVMNLTNPKVLLFFFAFLPQFVDPRGGSVAIQLAEFGVLFILSTAIVFSSIAYAAGHIGERLRRSQKVQRILNRTAAVVFAGLAVRLATSQR
jgi:threonine/homoserine/homoserine lactone efflux protein